MWWAFTMDGLVARKRTKKELLRHIGVRKVKRKQAGVYHTRMTSRDYTWEVFIYNDIKHVIQDGFEWALEEVDRKTSEF